MKGIPTVFTTQAMPTESAQIHSPGLTDNGHTHAVTTAAHGHTVTDGGHTHALTAQALSTLPPYYALCFIMKL